MAVGPYLTLCTSEEEFRVALKRMKCPYDGDPWVMDSDSARCHTLAQGGKATACIVCIDLAERSPAAIAAALAHEAVHVWQGYCREIGEDAPGDETEAYAIQNIAYVLIAEAFARQATTP